MKNPPKFNHIEIHDNEAVTTPVSVSATDKAGARNSAVHQAILCVLMLCILFVAWLLSIRQLETTRRTILDGLRKEQNNLVAIVAENLSQVLEQHRALKILVKRAVDADAPKVLEAVPQLLSGQKAFNRLVVYDLSGNALYQSSPGTVPEKIREKLSEHLRAMIDSGAALSVCPLLRQATDPWLIPLMIPLKTTRSGDLVMLLEADLGYVLNLYLDIDLGQTGYITIQTEAGEVLATARSGGLVLQGDTTGMAFPKELYGEHGTTLLRSFTSEQGVQTTYRHLDHFPLTVSAGSELAEVLAKYDAARTQQIVILVLVSGFGLLGFFWLVRVSRKKDHYLHELMRSNLVNTQLIQELEQEHQKAVDAASFDPLTNLHNRRLFLSLARRNLLLTKRNKINYALLFIDLDRFKAINDSLGHRVGDLLLKAVAGRLLDCVRETDIVARFGGDEFVLLLTGVNPDKDVPMVARKIAQCLSEPYEDLDGYEVLTSPSIGVAIHPRDGEDIDTLLRNADAAMYESKRGGRGRFTFFDQSLNTVSVQLFELEQRLPKAIQDNEFLLHYQPKIQLDDYRLVGLEALVRWDHPDHQLIYPGDFIPTAEATGRIVELGYWILEETCRQMEQWRAWGLDLVPVAINVSPTQLKDEDFANRFFRTLATFELNPADIEIEVTESSFFEDHLTIQRTLETLCEKGVTISLDDFGNGFSSLDHIRTLPIQTLKIDRSFIQNLRKSTSDTVIVASTIELAKKLDLVVVAEGVETTEQLMHLKVAGCDQVQGYYFSRPIFGDDVVQFLRDPLRIPAS